MKKTVLLSILFFVAASLVNAQVNKETKKDLPIKEAASSVQTVAKTANGSGTNSTQAVNVVSYDFTTGSGQYYGGANGAVELETGVWGMIAGNADPTNNTVDASDRSETWNERNQTGYLNSDVDMSGVTDAGDRSTTWNNRNKSSSVPN